MSLENILSIHERRKDRKVKIYDNIYSKLKTKIEYYVRYNKVSCGYNIPTFIYGCPNFNRSDIADYIEKKLRNEGFTVVRVNETGLYIYWEEELIKRQLKKNSELKKLKEYEKELKQLEEDRNNEMLKSFVNKSN